jgi:glycosyltransferase involved in cell wall biosynthesis
MLGRGRFFKTIFILIGFSTLCTWVSLRVGFEPDITILGPVNMADGIGRQTGELAKFLSLSHNVEIRPTKVNKKNLPLDVKKILTTKYLRRGKICVVQDCLWSPGTGLTNIFHDLKNEDQIRFAYSMVEFSHIPPEWVMILNLYFDAVIVPDEFLVKAYQRSGVEIPIFFIPLGLDLSSFAEVPLKKRISNKPFVFASLGTCIERKNHLTMVKAFAKAFGNRDDVLYHINCRAADPTTRRELFQEILNLGCKNIRYTENCLNSREYAQFFQRIDCLLSLSKGEGFSIQPREAMALGIPCILSDNTAQSLICKSGLVRSVASTIFEPAFYQGKPIPEAIQYNCEIEECVKALKEVYENYDSYLLNSQKMRNWALQYDYTHLINLYEGLFFPEKIILGDKNEIKGKILHTSSKDLMDKYQKLRILSK